MSEVFYDPSSNPLRMSLDFSTVGPDLRPLPPRRQELFINNIQVHWKTVHRPICSSLSLSVKRTGLPWVFCC